MPSALAVGGSLACGTCSGSQAYTACAANSPVGPSCNSLLDVLVGGCKVIACLAAAVDPTQPDVPAGATVTALTLNATTHKVNQATANDDDAYSAYLTFTANRAHFTGQTCAATTDCQTGKTCTAGVCK